MTRRDKIQRKDWLFGMTFIIIFIVGMLIANYLPINDATKQVFIFIIFLILFVVSLRLYGTELKQQWQAFKAKKVWLKLILSIALVGGIIILLKEVREVLPPGWLNQGNADLDGEGMFNLSITTIILSSLQPLLAPFYEEILFRYVMVGRASSGGMKVIMLIVQAIIFGLIHTFNFGGNPLATIPYMVVALYFGIIYMIFDNIWMTIIVHWLFNFMNSLLPVLIMLFMLLIN